MLNPELICHGNTAILNFITRFGKNKFINFYKNEEEEFKLTYTALSSIRIYNGSVKAIWKKYVEMNSVIGTLRSFYNQEAKIDYGEYFYIVKYYPLFNNLQWVILKNLPKDLRCININVDILLKNNLKKRNKVDPFTGEFLVVQ